MGKTGKSVLFCFVLFLIITGLLKPQKVFAENKIPVDAQLWNGHYYKIINKKMKPDAAEKYCEKRGGYLAAVTSQQEQDFLAQIAEKGTEDNYFIGATDFGDEGNWRWMNGEKWQYSNWYQGGAAGLKEPNNGLGSGEDYAVMNRDRDWQWVDVFGGYDNYTNVNCFICEWENGYTVSISQSKLILKPGQKQNIEYIIKNLNGEIINKNINFKSGNQRVAKVSSKGKVTAVNPGICKIVCKVSNVKKSVRVIVIPRKVSNVSGNRETANTVKLKWKKQMGVKGYEISMYNKDSGEYKKVKTVKGNQNMAIISKLKKGSRYRFRIRAYIKSGEKKYFGDYSNVYHMKSSL